MTLGDARPRRCSSPRLQRPRLTAAVALALLAALLLASGVGRCFVVCLGHGGKDAPHVALSHAALPDRAACCERGGEPCRSAPAADDAALPLEASGCIDIRLPGLEGKSGGATPPQPPLPVVCLVDRIEPQAASRLVWARAPATGPPRPCARMAARRTVVLLV